MNYHLFINKSAQKDLSNLPQDVYIHIRDAIRMLSTNPIPFNCLKLTERDGWRIRIGDYRVIYEIDDGKRKITILHIGHRRDVYR